MPNKLNDKPTLIPSYTRTELIKIARSTPVDQLQLPTMTIPNDTPEWRRRRPSLMSDDESLNQLLNESHNSSLIAKTLKAEDNVPIDNFRIVSASSPADSDTKLLFAYSSVIEDPKLPVLIDFASPFTNTGNRKASDAFQSSFPPPLTRNRSDSVSSTRAIGGDSFSNISLGSWASSSFSRKESLNPFAPPFSSNSSAIPSLPLPKALPISLPPRPGPLAPIFVKKEAATLPQPMSLPTVKPMGPDWLHDENVSGNERRRRASELPIMRVGQSFSSNSLEIPQSLGEKRPERLVKLGQSLRQSIAAKGETGQKA